ncbi:MAG TPA: GyrI-like domain-containing protein [Pirellulales bacterium]|jgi:predicted transcriptional regulator YdeE|nr:GyrI-like domain-containing protein [Pirellulales bacterium]
MKVMVMVKATNESESGAMPNSQILAEMGKFNEELVKAGIMLLGEGLHPSSKGARVRFSGTKRTVVDGPFAETKELVAGFWLWQVKSMDEAIAWVRRCPNPFDGESEIEIRRVFAPEDFDEAATPEILEREQRLRAELERYTLEPPRFENGQAMLIAGHRASYTLQTRTNIPTQWERFASQVGKISNRIGNTWYGVCWNYQPQGSFDYLAGVEVSSISDIPAEFSHLRLAAQRYAVFAHAKHVSSIADTLDAIWNKWLPNSGLHAAQAPCLERYGEAFDPQTGLGGMEIWLPIKE